LENIQKLCDERDVTIAQLERDLNFGRGSIYKWNKNSPSIDKVQKVAEYFGVSTDFLLYGFDKGEFTSLVNVARYRRSIKEFAKDTGLDEHYLNRLCSGVEYKQPSIDTVLAIAIANDNELVVNAQSLFKAAGYDLNELAGDLLSDIPLDLMHHYQKQGMSEAEMAIAYAKFKKAEFEDAMRNPGYDIQTLAAHHESEDWTEEELEEIERFKEFVRMKRKQKQQE
jgi:transcriptional regulator with XRE-family HTH domain